MGLIDLVDVGLFGLVSLVVFFFFEVVLVDVGLCRWWMSGGGVGCAGDGCGFVPVVGLGCGFVSVWSLWLCFFFFLRWRWWPSVFVPVVAVGDDDEDSDRNGEG